MLVERSVTRISDFTYRVKNPVEGGKDVYLHTTSHTGEPDFCFRLASAAAKVLFDAQGDVQFHKSFDYGLFRWTFSQHHKQAPSWGERILATLTSMVHRNTYTTVHQAYLVQQWRFIDYFNPCAYYRQVHPLLMSHRELTIEAIQTAGKRTNVPLVEAVKREQWRQGMRAKLAFDETHRNYRTARFSDPYTRLAALAHQHFESDFSSADELVPGDCATRLRLDGNAQLRLVDRQLQSEDDLKANKHTVRAYRAWLAQELGEDKLRYLEYFFKIDLAALADSGDGLTPEHVYRMNIGSQMLEVHDLHTARRLLKELRDSKRSFSELPGLLQRGLYRLLGEDCEKKAPAYLAKQDCLFAEQLNAVCVNTLIGLLRPVAEEKLDGFTGRRIDENIRAYYTRAGLNEYKPWVEVQELLQAFATVEQSESWEHFMEVVAMVLPKRQLVREHPSEGYRVGALIPAPPQNGTLRWYVVKSFASNNHGIMCYELEPLCADASLPSLLVARSTASSGCHIRWAASVLNDLNRLNSPGYEGSLLLRDYFLQVYKDRSIPVWCAYAYQAKVQLDIIRELPDKSPELFAPIQASLEQAQYEYLVAEATKLRPFSLSELLRNYDYILNPLYRECIGFPPNGHKETVKAFIRMHERELIPLRLGQHQPGETQLRDLAKRLSALLKQFKGEDDTLRTNAPDISTLIRVLDEHICTDTQKRLYDEQVVAANRAFEDQVDRLPILLGQALASEDYDAAVCGFERWTDIFMSRARELGEHPAQKQRGGLAFVGHSLGAAVCQQLLQSFFAYEQRLPLPEESVLGKFIYGPKINREDIDAYVKFATKHWELLQGLDMRVELCHHFEVGDPVPTSGQGEHLGAARSKEEDELLYRFQDFDGRLLERADCPSISNAVGQSTWAHETPFHHPTATLIEGDEEGDYRLYPFDARQMAAIDNKITCAGSDEPHVPYATVINGRLDPNASSRINLEAWRQGKSFNAERGRLEKQRRVTDRTTTYSDKDGVFIVSLEGVQTGAQAKEQESWTFI